MQEHWKKLHSEGKMQPDIEEDRLLPVKIKLPIIAVTTDKDDCCKRLLTNLKVILLMVLLICLGWTTAYFFSNYYRQFGNETNKLAFRNRVYESMEIDEDTNEKNYGDKYEDDILSQLFKAETKSEEFDQKEKSLEESVSRLNRNWQTLDTQLHAIETLTQEDQEMLNVLRKGIQMEELSDLVHIISTKEESPNNDEIKSYKQEKIERKESSEKEELFLENKIKESQDKTEPADEFVKDTVEENSNSNEEDSNSNEEDPVDLFLNLLHDIIITTLDEQNSSLNAESSLEKKSVEDSVADEDSSLNNSNERLKVVTYGDATTPSPNNIVKEVLLKSQIGESTVSDEPSLETLKQITSDVENKDDDVVHQEDFEQSQQETFENFYDEFNDPLFLKKLYAFDPFFSD